jgi:hypothetical protein
VPECLQCSWWRSAGQPWEARSDSIALKLGRGAVVLIILVPDALAIGAPHRYHCGCHLFIADVLNPPWAPSTGTQAVVDRGCDAFMQDIFV